MGPGLYGRWVGDGMGGLGAFGARPGVRMLWLVGAATVPTGLIGILFEDMFESWFANPAVLTLTFAVTGTLLFASRWAPQGRIDLGSMGLKHALILGLAQGCAITPGISRSGTTIVVAMFLGLERGLAARFSFLISVPAILGAVVLKSRDVDMATMDPLQLGVGAVTALVSGYLALVVLVGLVKRGRLSGFAWYCWAAALFSGGLALWFVSMD